ncbi:uncharacterized protein [Nicotiana tomentosiformis]|uniref:uncharacterized protein n=1 Tax=Nicotiana tomentosiformis TaxID=4098 RepID=UPI00388C56A2
MTINIFQGRKLTGIKVSFSLRIQEHKGEQEDQKVDRFQTNGISLYLSRLPNLYWQEKNFYFFDLASKVLNKAGGWQGNLLSFGGRAIIIKHILQSQILYLLAAMVPPKAIISQIVMYLSNFFWGENKGKKSYDWSSWENLSYLHNKGGVGFKKL